MLFVVKHGLFWQMFKVKNDNNNTINKSLFLCFVSEIILYAIEGFPNWFKFRAVEGRVTRVKPKLQLFKKVWKTSYGKLS